MAREKEYEDKTQIVIPIERKEKEFIENSIDKINGLPPKKGDKRNGGMGHYHRFHVEASQEKIKREKK